MMIDNKILNMGNPLRTPGKLGKADEDGGHYASPDQKRAYEEGRALYGDVCPRCNKRGHWQAECPMRWQSNNMVCDQCGSTEHSQYNCPEVARALRREKRKRKKQRQKKMEKKKMMKELRKRRKKSKPDDHSSEEDDDSSDDIKPAAKRTKFDENGYASLL